MDQYNISCNYLIKFGKHKGKRLIELINEDGYFTWLKNKNPENGSEFKKVLDHLNIILFYKFKAKNIVTTFSKNTVIKFGKYKNSTLFDICNSDLDYARDYIYGRIPNGESYYASQNYYDCFIDAFCEGYFDKDSKHTITKKNSRFSEEESSHSSELSELSQSSEREKREEIEEIKETEQRYLRKAEKSEKAERTKKQIISLDVSNEDDDIPVIPVAEVIKLEELDLSYTLKETLFCFLERKNVEEIALFRKLTKGTIETHLIELHKQKYISLDIDLYVVNSIREFIDNNENYKLKDIKEFFEENDESISYFEIKKALNIINYY